MSAVKLIKKQVRNMGIGINNGKDYTNNIPLFILLIAVFVSFLFVNPAYAEPVPKNWVIVIDPGHGGRDPGALGSFSKEKDLTLAIALKTGEYLEKNLSNVKVLYTRKTDVFVDLKERAAFANKNKADLFISVHVNAVPQKYINGTETFIMGHTMDEQNLQVAMKENAVILLEEDYSTKYEDFDPQSPESYIMFSIMQNVYQKQSTDLASKIQNQFRERVNRVDRGVKQAGFWVLYMTTMPSVLVETGFITNVTEEKFLNSKEGQEYIASAIYRACRDYINEMDIRSGISAVRNETVRDSAGTPESSEIKVGIAFMVQVSTSGSQKELKPENFKGLTDISEIRAEDRFKYATGNFATYPAAVEFRKKIANIYPDAFVIAVKEGKILPLQDALDQAKRN